MSEKNKIIVFITVIVILFGGLFFLAKSGQNTTKVADPNKASPSISALKASETFYDFGKISMKYGYAKKTFIVSNPTHKNFNL